MLERIFSSVSLLEKGLDAASLRGQVIQNNIANAETPNFKSSSVDFESHFRAALSGQTSSSGFEAKTTHEKHIKFGASDGLTATVRTNSNITKRYDGNNVDVDYQNAELAKNQLLYNALINKVNSEFTRLSMAIREGR